MAIMTNNDIMIAAITPAERVDVDLVEGFVAIGDSVDPPQSRIPCIPAIKRKNYTMTN